MSIFGSIVMSALVQWMVVGRLLETPTPRCVWCLFDRDALSDSSVRVLSACLVLAWHHRDLGCLVVCRLSHQGGGCVLEVRLSTCVITRHGYGLPIREICKNRPPEYIPLDCLSHTCIWLAASTIVAFHPFRCQFECLSEGCIEQCQAARFLDQ